MTTAQKIIKYLAMAFAIFLIVTIFSAILSAIYGVSSLLRLNKNTDAATEMKEINTELNNSFVYLDIELKSTKLTIKTGEKFNIQTNNDNIKINESNSKLEIKEKGWLSKNKDKELILYVPGNIKFEKVKIDNGTGTIKIENLYTGKLDLDLGAGETIIDDITSNETEIDSGAGALKIKSGNIRNLDIDIGVGKADITAKLIGNSKVDTGIGSLNLNLLGAKDEYKLKINKGIGNVSVDGNAVQDNEVIGNSENIVNINGGIGEIIINFQESIK